jgi:hypothetical protein
MTRPRTTPVEDWDTVLTGGPTPPRSSFGDGILLRPQTTPTRPACAEFDSRVAHKGPEQPWSRTRRIEGWRRWAGSGD